MLAYRNSFQVPLLLDDASAITHNPTIRSLADLRPVLLPPREATTAGRPLLNLSFALNWACDGDRVVGYHIVNLAIHLAAALLLFGLVRRVLVHGTKAVTMVRYSSPIATIVTLIWALHPAQTEAVTYISQRAESFMGCCYLGTLYCFVRSVATGQRSWAALSVGFCLAGMAVKEVMATAPLAVLLLDRAGFSSSFRTALRQRWRLYTGLLVSWVLLALLAVQSHLDTWTPETGAAVSWWVYALNETGIVLNYLKLAAWPHPLVFDYGIGRYVGSLAMTGPSTLAIVALLGVIGWWWNSSKLIGFAAGMFFLLLAPTSSVLPIATQPMAESRMYLPLAAVTVLAVAVTFHLVGRRLLLPAGLLIFGLAVLTFSRNNAYQSTVAIWSDSAAKFPLNDRARSNLGLALWETPGRSAEAKAEYEAALRLNPLNPDTHYNLANTLGKDAATAPAAIEHYRAALRLRPRFARAHNNLGLLLWHLADQPVEALKEFEAAVRDDPADPSLRSNLASLLVARFPGRDAEAIAQYRAVVKLSPHDPALRFNLATALLSTEQYAEAVSEYRVVVKLAPDYIEAHNNLGAALLRIGQRDAAIAEFELAAQLRPGDLKLQENLRILRQRNLP